MPPHRFRNWAGTHGCTPVARHLPSTEAEVVSLVREAARTGATLKPVGAGHSFGDIACTDGHLVSLDRLDRVLFVDAARREVTVQAGIRLRALNELLPRHGLALANLGSIAEQSVAGAIATGTHGTGARLGNLATQVASLRLVTGTGEVLRLGRASTDRDADRFAAARVGLGCLGVVTEVTLACAPAFRLEERAFALPFDEAVERLEELALAHDHTKLWWLPHTRAVQVYAYDRTPRTTPRRSALARRVDASRLVRGAFATLLAVGAARPAWVPTLNELVRRSYFTPRHHVDRSDRVLNIPMPPGHREMEYAMAREAAPAALRALRAMVERERLRVNFPVEVRFVAADDAWMSPAYGRATCQIGAYMRESADRARYFDGFERMMLAMGGRPHWGKEHSPGPAALRRAFPRYDDFDSLRRELDPSGIFESAFTERTFGARRRAR